MGNQVVGKQVARRVEGAIKVNLLSTILNPHPVLSIILILIIVMDTISANVIIIVPFVGYMSYELMTLC